MLNKLKPTQYLVVVGGALVFIFGLLKWFSWDVKNDDVIASSDKSNAFDYLFTGVIPWILVAGAALVTILLATGALNPGKVPWPLVILAATVLGAILVIVRLIIGPDVDPGEGFSVDSSRGIGIWVSALGAIVAAVGAFLTYQAESFDSRTSLAGGTGPSPRPLPDRELPPTEP
jgi:hypothetical protein